MKYGEASASAVDDSSVCMSTGGLDWASWIRRGDRIVCAQMTGEPRALIADLTTALRDRGVAPPEAIFLGTPFSTEAAAFPPEVRLEVFGGMGMAAAIGRSRLLSVYPVHYSRCVELFADDGLRVDVVLVSLARHPVTGCLYFAPSHGYVIDAARRARHVIAEINTAAPCVRGTEWPEDLVLSAVVEVRYPLAVAPETRASDLDRAIGANVSGCVEDGATIQVGIGAVASAVAAGLASRRHLRIHSGLFTEPLWALRKGGAVEAPAGREAVVTCSAVYGSTELYAEVHDNPAYRIAPPAETHGLASLAALPRFTAINSALEIDLFGQVNAESVGGRYLGGIGGLNDFIRGALASRGGTAIIAVPSRRRSRRGEVASIVPALSGPATVPAADADVFVTEHGSARMRGLSRNDRARAIIGLAHPEDREALTRAAHSLGFG